MKISTKTGHSFYNNATKTGKMHNKFKNGIDILSKLIYKGITKTFKEQMSSERNQNGGKSYEEKVT